MYLRNLGSQFVDIQIKNCVIHCLTILLLVGFGIKSNSRNRVIKQEQVDTALSVQLFILNTRKSIARVNAWQDEVKDEVKVLLLLF